MGKFWPGSSFEYLSVVFVVPQDELTDSWISGIQFGLVVFCDNSQPKHPVASTAPTSSARMNHGTWRGSMPEKVSVSDRANVTAGFANDVEAVNQ